MKVVEEGKYNVKLKMSEKILKKYNKMYNSKKYIYLDNTEKE